MSRIRNVLRDLTPFGLVERHRRNFYLPRLGVGRTADVAAAVKACRFDLWPTRLRQATKPWTLIDVGANCGEFTAAVARLTTLEQVHVFEPDPVCYGQLQRVVASIPRAQLHRCAAGEQSGEIELLCAHNSKMTSVLAPAATVSGHYPTGDFGMRTQIKVPLVKLDDVIPIGMDVGLLKIDTQGYELPVLKGAKRTLLSTFAVLIEVNYVAHYKGGATYDDLHEVMRANGFRTFGVSAPYSGLDGPLWADALFVRDE